VAPDVIPAGTGNIATVRHTRAARTLDDRMLLSDLRVDFVGDATASLSTDRGPIGVPWLANPRRYVWRADTLAGLGARVPETWEEIVQTCVKNTAGRPRATGRPLLAVNGLHLEFYEALRQRGISAIEFGRASFAGDEGVSIAQYFADRGQTDTIGRYGSGTTWGSDLVGQGIVGAWTTLAGLMRVLSVGAAGGSLLQIGPPIGAGGRDYPQSDAPPKGAIATHAWWYVSASTTAPDQALELVRALVEPDAMLEAAKASWQVPTRRSAGRRGFLTHALVQQFVGPYLDDGLSAPALPAQIEMEPILLNRLNAVARGEIRPLAALREAARLWDDAIAKTSHADEAQR
jgi:ABC-type glycerol-3-phosphate transport system substrate-binding protein